MTTIWRLIRSLLPLLVAPIVKTLTAFVRAHKHPHSERRSALLMVYTGLGRVAIWIALLLAYPLSHGVQHLYSSIAFVSLLSVGALLLTDWGQVAASLAQLTATAAHDAASQARTAIQLDIQQLDEDVGKLANLEPGPEAAALADEIKKRLGTDT